MQNLRVSLQKRDFCMTDSESQAERDRKIRRVILIEGTANATALLLKLLVGFSTGSFAILADAIHSLGDVLNNGIAWLVVRASARPADREHPYGHRKLETLAVFVLASLLVVLAVELGLSALRREPEPILAQNWEIALMLAVLCGNLGLATWENAWAKRLSSDILGADARHTLADVLTTVIAILGWQAASRGYTAADTASALLVSLFVLLLAFGLFRNAIPILIDHIAVAPEALSGLARSVPEVRRVKQVRSRSKGSSAAVDMIITVHSSLSMTEAHAVADEIETRLRDELGIDDATIHIEPEP